QLGRRTSQIADRVDRQHRARRSVVGDQHERRTAKVDSGHVGAEVPEPPPHRRPRHPHPRGQIGFCVLRADIEEPQLHRPGSVGLCTPYSGAFPHASPNRHPQRRHRGSRGPREDHARRRHALAVGRLPQTRFVLRKALESHLPVILVINKVDRTDARIKDVVDEVYQLFLDLDAQEHHIEFPIVYCNARAGQASLDADKEGVDLEPLFTALLEHIPPPSYDEDHPLQAFVTNLDASPYVGRLALCRIHHGELHKGQTVAWCRADGSIERAKLSELYVASALERVSADSAGPGEIAAIAGIAEVTIGETLADPEDPRPLPVLHVDDPSLSMTIGVNTSPLSGRAGRKLTARLVKALLGEALVCQVSGRVWTPCVTDYGGDV